MLPSKDMLVHGSSVPPPNLISAELHFQAHVLLQVQEKLSPPLRVPSSRSQKLQIRQLAITLSPDAAPDHCADRCRHGSMQGSAPSQLACCHRALRFPHPFCSRRRGGAPSGACTAKGRVLQQVPLPFCCRRPALCSSTVLTSAVVVLVPPASWRLVTEPCSMYLDLTGCNLIAAGDQHRAAQRKRGIRHREMPPAQRVCTQRAHHALPPGPPGGTATPHCQQVGIFVQCCTGSGRAGAKQGPCEIHVPLCQRVGLDKVSLKLWQEQQESLACASTWQADPGMAV